MFSFENTMGGPSRTSSGASILTSPSRPALKVPDLGSLSSTWALATYTARYPRSTGFQRTNSFTTPELTYGFISFGVERPVTGTSPPRPICSTASAATSSLGRTLLAHPASGDGQNQGRQQSHPQRSG